MAFKFWSFKFTPPKTVTAPVPVADGSAVSGSVLAPSSSAPASSKARRLMGKLEEMNAAAEYLQQVLLARSQGLGIALDAKTDIDVARALEVVYGVDEAPAVITLEMYNHLLDAEMAALQTEMALPLDSPYEVNAFQVATASQITHFVEDKLVSSGEFRNTLPLLLRNLKGDQVIYQSAQQELAKYPAAQTAVPRDLTDAAPIQAQNLDMGDDFYSAMDGALDEAAGGYASMYKLAAEVSQVERGFEDVVDTYFMQPIEDVIRLLSMFQAMKGLIHVPRLKSIINGLTGFVFVRLQSEVMKLRGVADRFMNLGAAPLRSITGSMGQALGKIQSAAMQADRVFGAASNAKTAGQQMVGSLKGMSLAYDCGMPHRAAAKKPHVQNATSPALTAMAAHLQWGLHQFESKKTLIDEAFDKVASRRLADTASTLDLLCSLKSLDSLLNLATAVSNIKQRGHAASVSGRNQALDAVGRILTSGGSTTGTQFVLQDGHLQAIAPSVPAIPTTVAPVLSRGGLDSVVS